MGSEAMQQPTRPVRRILVRYDPAGGDGALATAVEIAARDRATIDLCGLVRRRSVLLCLALLGGVPFARDQLEAEEAEELARAMRRAVASLPRDLGIRSFLLCGDARRKLRDLLAAGDYDLVV